ncbi:MAG: VCBS repeat-containing protein, partial [Planctomycetales bacterium]|nr:VCBS repeat-containing protein [Planctomycetales bacterium]
PDAAPQASVVADTNSAYYRDANGNVTRTILDQQGREVYSQDAEGRLPTFTRNENNLLGSITDARGNITTFEYDERGNVIQSTDDIVRGSNGSSLFSGQVFPVGGVPTKIAYGDVNGDGHIDLVAVSRENDSVSLLPGRGDGTFGDAVVLNIRDPNNLGRNHRPLDVAIADLNRDGNMDLVVANTIADTIGVAFGNGDFSFQPIQVYDSDFSPVQVAIGDLNGDLFPDIVSANDVGGGRILINSGDGTFTEGTRLGLTFGHEAVFVGDLNSDGVLDIVADAFGGAAVAIGNGDGTFQAFQSFAIPTGEVAGSALADIDRDTTLDLIVPGSNEISVFPGLGDGTFAAPRSIPTSEIAGHVVAADLNGDSWLDVVAGSRSLFSDRMALVLINDQNGNLVQSSSFEVWGSQLTLVSEDFNEDSVADIAAVSFANDEASVAVYINPSGGAFETASTTVVDGDISGIDNIESADLNGDLLPDLVLGGTNLSIVLGTGGDFGPVVETIDSGTVYRLRLGDLDNDGTTDIVALLASRDTIVVSFGNGDGTFATPLEIAVPARRSDLELADLDHDNDLDIIVGGGLTLTPGDDHIAIIVNNGDGTFEPTLNVAMALPAEDIMVGHFDADDDLDIVAAHGFGQNQITFLAGNGDGTFATGVMSDGVLHAEFAVAADYNDDGVMDVVVATVFGDGQLSLLLANGDGTFQAPVILPTDPIDNMQSLKSADVDVDGNPAVLILGDDSFSVLSSNGDGTVAEPQSFGLPERSRAFAVVESRNSGTFDVVVADRDLHLLRNRSSVNGPPAEPLRSQFDPVFNVPTAIVDELGRQTLFEID